MATVGGSDVTFLEREDELAAVSAALERSIGGDGGMLAIVGPAGIGKTRLLARLRESASDHRVTTLFARGSELERDFAFGVARQLFETRIARSPTRERAKLLAGAAGLAAALVSPATTPLETSPSARAFDAVHGLYWLTVNIAEDGPLLLAVDDAHWADPDSLRYLAYLVARLEQVPVLVALAARPWEPEADQPLLDTLLGDPLVDTLELRPLSEPAVRRLVRARIGDSAENAFCDACRSATGGNPFLLSELLFAVEQEQIEPTAAAASSLMRLSPANIRRAVLARLGRLSDDARALASAVAVLGGQGPLRIAAAIAELSEATALATTDDLIRAEIVRGAKQVEFVHPLVRAAVYLDLPAQRRSRLHARAASLLAAADAPADEIAAHLIATEPHSDARAVDVLREAAASALRRGALDSAARYLRRALEEPPSPDSLSNVLLELGVVLGVGDDPDAVGALKRAVATAPDMGRRAHVALRSAQAMSRTGSHPEAIEFCLAGIVAGDGADPETLVRLEAELVFNARLVASAVPLALERLDRLSALARPGSSGESLLLVARALINTLAGNAAAQSEKAVEQALHLGLLDEEESGIVYLAATLPSFNGQLDLATNVCNAAIERARSRGWQPAVAAFAQWRSIAELSAGSITDAVADASEAFQIVRELGIAGRWPIACLTDALIARGELDAAERAHARFAGELPEHFTSAMLIQSRGRLRCAQGRLNEGVADLREAGRRWHALQVEHPAVASWRDDAAAALGALGERDEAAELAAQQLERARCVATNALIGSALRTQGLIAGGEPGIGLLGEAVALLEPSDARLAHANALVDLGALLRRAGHRRDARAPLGEGLALARRCGALALATRAYEELKATGARPRRILRTGVDALTPSEHRVARLAAQGMSNKEIAQALFVTVRTVETHLHSTYRKLDIATRAELSAALGRA